MCSFKEINCLISEGTSYIYLYRMSHIYLVVLFPNIGIIRFVDWVANDTQCAVCKVFQGKSWIESTSNSIELSEYYVKARSKCCSSRPLFAKKGSNSVSQTGQDNHHNTLYRTGKEEERGKI